MRIVEKVEIKWVKPSELKNAEYNPRYISDNEFRKLKQSMLEFGFAEPIVVNSYPGRENVIIGGHQRVKAAIELGLENIPIAIVNLEPGKEKLLNLALNRIQGDWKEDKLIEVLKNLDEHNENLNLSGFDEREIDRLLAGFNKDGKDEEIPDTSATPTIAKLGDIWQLGKHKILCGDNTDPENYKKLIGSDIIDLVITDPPYNLGYTYHSYEDKVKPEEYKEQCKKWFEIVKGLSDKVLITIGPQNIAMWCEIEKPKWIIAWLKRNANSGCALRGFNKWEPIVLYGKFEPVLFYGNVDKIIPWDVITDAEFNKTDDVYDVRTAFMEDRDEIAKIHSCPKPVKLWHRLIKDFTRTEHKVLDIFIGSGTALIACEKSKRVCFGMEIDPYYVDVCIARWEAYTGLKAVKLQ